ncbi:MAG: aminotransferase class V-fold PLP-dependent enzyme [Oscillospiraceae bacterium]|nr:aminotransferase class V-fold PLP-dependent enzyme [Oscillospiraceae bacterium]
MSVIYFDNAASMKPCQAAIDAFNEVISENYANPSALHKGGIEAENLVGYSKGVILSAFGDSNTKNGELIFTSGATESNNMAILYSVKPRGKTKIVTTAVEHPSVSEAIAHLEQNDGYEVVRVSPINGDLEIANAVCENTALVSVTAVCGETGFVLDMESIYKQIKARFPNCIVHVDASQGFCKPDKGVTKVERAESMFYTKQINSDLISISAHKIGGIAGVGALYIRKNTMADRRSVRILTSQFGGGQQGGIRSGTEPVALIYAFAKGIESVKNMPSSHYEVLQSRLLSGLERLGIAPHVRESNSIPNIVNFSCGVKSEIMLHFLAEQRVYVSSGSACAKGKKSKILPAYGISDKDIDTSIRVSFGWQNTVDEVDRFLEILESGINRWVKAKQEF